MSAFDPVQTAGGQYAGVSGYGEGSMMTLTDYSKFLRMLCQKGYGPDGTRVLGPVAWKWMMSPTINAEVGLEIFQGSVSGINAYGTGDWRMGYLKDRSTMITNNGMPFRSTDDFRIQTSQYGGRWGGYFGTAYYFDVDSGLYWVGGENTLSSLTGQAQLGFDLMAGRGSAWMAHLTSANGVQEQSRIGNNPPEVSAAASAEDVCPAVSDCKASQAAAGVFGALFFILLFGVLFKDGHLHTAHAYASEKTDGMGKHFEWGKRDDGCGRCWNATWGRLPSCESCSSIDLSCCQSARSGETFENVLVEHEGGENTDYADGAALDLNESDQMETSITI